MDITNNYKQIINGEKCIWHEWVCQKSIQEDRLETSCQRLWFQYLFLEVGYLSPNIAPETVPWPIKAVDAH